MVISPTRDPKHETVTYVGVRLIYLMPSIDLNSTLSLRCYCTSLLAHPYVNVYIESKGLICPFCKTAAVQGRFVQIEAGKAVQDMNCLECEGRWQDVYELIDVIPEKGE